MYTSCHMILFVLSLGIPLHPHAFCVFSLEEQVQPDSIMMHFVS